MAEEDNGGARPPPPPAWQQGLWKKKTMVAFVAGGSCAAFSTIALQPLDVIKTHIQASRSSPSPAILQVARFVVSRDGISGLWRGTMPACLRVGLGAGLYFSILGPVLSVLSTDALVGSSSTENLRSKLPVSVTLGAGAITRSLAAFLVCPITVVKTRMEYEAMSGLHYPNTVKAIAVISRTEGLKGLYSGLLPTIVRDAPYSGLYLLLYTRLRHGFSDWQVAGGSSRLYVNILAGAIAGASATVLTHPPDVIRTRLQLDDKNHTGVFSAVRHVFQMHGIRGFFAGVLPRAGRRAIHQALSWTMFEEIMRWSEMVMKS